MLAVVLSLSTTGGADMEMSISEWRRFVLEMEPDRFLGPDGFMTWLMIVPAGRRWFENWRTMDVHPGWRS
jgi:hypothetical protein